MDYYITYKPFIFSRLKSLFNFYVKRTAHRQDFGAKFNLTYHNGALAADILKKLLDRIQVLFDSKILTSVDNRLNINIALVFHDILKSYVVSIYLLIYLWCNLLLWTSCYHDSKSMDL